MFLRRTMKRKPQQTAKLEAELLRLNDLVRQRREQLARLEDCPHTECECRRVWNKVVEDKLASQVHKVRKHVRGTRAKSCSSNKSKRGKD